MQDINKKSQNTHQGKLRPKILNHNLKIVEVKYT